jgi:transposase
MLAILSMQKLDLNSNDAAKLKKYIQAQQVLIEEKETRLNQYQSELKQYQKQNNILEAEVSHLTEALQLLRQKHFGKSSEAVSSQQLGIFNEAEVEAASLEADSLEIKSYKRGKPKRKQLPDNLPREEVIIELEGKDRLCPHDGQELTEIGKETSEKLDIIPAQIKVIKTIRKKYACKTCEDFMKTSPVPPEAIPKSLATAGLLAYIAISKYTDGLPLYRLEKILGRIGADISRGTLASWMIRVGELLLPIKNLLNDELLESDYIQCDETRVQVLKEKGKKATSLSYMWVRARWGPENNPIILFDYSPDRSAKTAQSLLEGFKGHLQVDGYDGYNTVCLQEQIIRLACWAHVRRKFSDAFKASKKKHDGKAGKALKFIKLLYKVEEECRGWATQKRYELRQAKSKETVEEFKAWLLEHKDRVPPKTLLGKAIGYALNQWPHLLHYLGDGRLEIDNNLVENAIRPFAIGRKNWLFSDTVAGAEASATIYSVLQTAIANGHDVYSYMRYLLQELPKAKSLEDYEALLPYRVEPQSILITPQKLQKN